MNETIIPQKEKLAREWSDIKDITSPESYYAYEEVQKFCNEHGGMDLNDNKADYQEFELE
jgi:hypothetical protein